MSVVAQKLKNHTHLDRFQTSKQFKIHIQVSIFLVLAIQIDNNRAEGRHNKEADHTSYMLTVNQGSNPNYEPQMNPGIQLQNHITMTLSSKD